MAIGRFNIDRQLFEHEIWRIDRFSRGQAWIDLIGLAQYKPTSYTKRGITLQLKRGDVARSKVELADRWKWNYKTVERFLLYLSNEKMITITEQKTRLTTLISITNYNTYQLMYRTERGTEDRTEDRTKRRTEDIRKGERKNLRKRGRKDRTKGGYTIKDNTDNEINKVNKDDDRSESSSINFEIFENEILEIWNNSVGDIVPKIKKLTEARRRQFKTALATMGASSTEQTETIKKIGLKINGSDYLSGRLDSTRSTNWDWVMESEDNWRKIYDGKYDNRKVVPVVSQPKQRYPHFDVENY